MIVTKDLECFKDFIADVEEVKVPFRILGYLADEAPAVTFFEGGDHPPRSFTGRLLLCSSMMTVMFKASLPIEEKPAFNDFLNARNVRLMKRLVLDDNGVVRCE
jgi:hypothetical protein